MVSSKDSFMMKMGHRLRLVRNTIPRSDFANLTGISRQHIRDLEDGRKLASAEILCRIANGLKVKPSELVRRLLD